MPFESCGALWRLSVPSSPNNHTIVDIYDRDHRNSEDRALVAARAARDELAALMPFPLTALIRQYTDGTFATEFRYQTDRNQSPVWTASYYRFDEVTFKPRAAMLSRSESVFGYEGARAELEKAWRQKVLEQADIIDRLVRDGVPVLHHGPASGLPEGRGSRAKLNHASQFQKIKEFEQAARKTRAALARAE